jgi:Glycosyltransferase family 87
MGGALSRNPLRWPVAAGLLMQAGFVAMALPGLKAPLRIAIQIALFAVFLAALRGVARSPLDAAQLRAALGLAVVFRLTLLVAAPFYSDDLYRYIWDGRVQVTGHINPYLHAPRSEALAPLRDNLFPRINHSEIPTIYPPVSQFLFVLVAAVSQSAFAVKGAMILCDLLLMAVLLRVLARARIPATQILIYAWNPLVVAEVAGNGHVDILAVLLLITGIHLIISKRSALSTIALGLSAGAKFLPLLAFPILARRVRRRHWLLAVLALAAVYLPYASAGSALFRGLREYAERWQHNDSLFTLLLAGLDLLHPTPALKQGIAWLQRLLDDPAWIGVLYSYAYPVYLARILAFLLAVSLAVTLAWRRADPVRGTFLLIAGVLLLSPTVHPWYLLWIAPFLALCPSRAWVLLSGLAPLSYLDPGPMVGGHAGISWVRWAEYLPFFALLLADAVASRRRGGAVTLFAFRRFKEEPEVARPEKERAGEFPRP